MFKKFKPTILIVLLFLVWLVTAMFAEPADAGQPTLSLGHTILNASQSVGELGYRTDNNKWEAGVALLGEGSTKRGYSGLAPVAYASRIVNPNWEFLGGENYLRIGLAYVDDFPLVGAWNYRLGAGLRWGDKVELEYFHYSSAGINELNTGVDGIQFRLLLGD